MWVLTVLFSMTAAIGAVMISQEARLPALSPALAADQARNMALYRAAVVDYVHNHADFTGVVESGELWIPQWFQPDQAWRNVVLPDGTVIVYAAQPPSSSLLAGITALSQNSMLAGVVRQGTDGVPRLFSPLNGDTGIVLPALPIGAVVWVSTPDPVRA